MRRFMGLVTLGTVAAAVAEVALFVLVARQIGFGWAVLAGMVTTLLGTLLLRREGVRAWRRFRDAAQQGRPPGDTAADGLVGLAGGLLLAMPGFLTDLAGLVLVAPPTRRLARARLRRAAERRLSTAGAGGVFGPRRVRVRVDREDVASGAAPGTPPVTPEPPRQVPGPTIEGEIVSDDPRP